uniref:Uncharacterized protein n=1 Tax=Onchocerca volvulus TaxID=6282 RepID=A0A8R1Y4T2_ONCVO
MKIIKQCYRFIQDVIAVYFAFSNLLIHSNMLTLRFLLILSIIRISQTCLRTTKQRFYGLKDIISELNTCHSCPEYKSSDCATFKKGLRCMKSKAWYYHDSYCLSAQFACNRSFLLCKDERMNYQGPYCKGPHCRMVLIMNGNLNKVVSKNIAIMQIQTRIIKALNLRCTSVT